VGGHSRAAMAFRHRLAGEDFAVTVLTRAPDAALGAETVVTVADYFSPPAEVLRGVEVVVNFAGLVTAEPSLLQAVNADGPARLAAAAKVAGARHFVQISSLSVYGHAPDIDARTPEAPVSAYGRSKLAGDRALAPLADDGFAITAMRVPILYGRDTGGKLHQLARLMRRLGWFAVPRVCEPRSVLHLDNLAGAVETVIRQRLGGVRFAADPQAFHLDLLPDILSGPRIRLICLPALLFSLIRLVSPGTYASLYGKSLITADCVTIPDARQLRDGLADLI
jgi:UDP-glucose 4-epimerase